jgi:hypothetical protein
MPLMVPPSSYCENEPALPAYSIKFVLHCQSSDVIRHRDHTRSITRMKNFLLLKHAACPRCRQLDLASAQHQCHAQITASGNLPTPINQHVFCPRCTRAG